jgi:hypothetical protein
VYGNSPNEAAEAVDGRSSAASSAASARRVT